ncbi:hypothetical protein Cni_G20654 [Canna indica]|uniref:BHLH domain-containing protein n=1 Tax=Canna indica TaxID=4628 RepID=A0AAQ3KNI9_9LILI|nr:hypothetical protein Cni_G20654 [Canna indica]
MASEASWGSFHPEMSVEESEIMAQLLASQSFDQDQDPSAGIQQMLWPDSSAADHAYYNQYLLPQTNVAGSLLHTPAAYEDYYFSDPCQIAPAIRLSSTPTNLRAAGEKMDALSTFPVDAYHHQQQVCLNEEASSEEVADSFAKLPPRPHTSQAIKRRHSKTEDDDRQVESLKKKARASASVPRKGKNAQAKKAQKMVNGSTCNEEEEEMSYADMNPPQSSCCYSSEDDSNGSHELKGVAAATSSCSKGSADLTISCKKRAGRGSATDPQSLYARKRRERINERLRILQTLVPNGTKVDISTMLEEAVQYVKFLQLQIKLLSSDELWMYAPIAYNGMSLGFDLKVSPQSQQ